MTHARLHAVRYGCNNSMLCMLFFSMQCSGAEFVKVHVSIHLFSARLLVQLACHTVYVGYSSTVCTLHDNNYIKKNCSHDYDLG